MPAVSIARLLKRIVRGVVGVFLPFPSVPPDERLKASFGDRTRSARRGQGWLILTKDRLMFERAVMWFSLARLYPSPNFSVALHEITQVQRLSGEIGDRAPFVPVLALTLTSGEQFFVQLVDIADWIDALDTVRAEQDASH
jgi:hypothetical protein